MCLKIRNFIGVFALLLAGLSSSLSNDTAASGLQAATRNTSNAEGSRQPLVVAVSYGTTAYTSYASPGADAAVADKSSVSAVSEVGVGTVLLAILGLAGMRLRRGGKKYLSAIN